MNTTRILKAIGIALLDAIIITAIMLPLVMSGVLPISQPFAATFVKTVFGQGTPLPVGVVFHLVYVTFWATLFVLFWKSRPILNAAILAVALWIVHGVVFAPIVGWGVFGSNVATMKSLFPILPHALFFLVLAITGIILNKKGSQPSQKPGNPEEEPNPVQSYQEKSADPYTGM